MTLVLVAAYLVALVLANLLIFQMGQVALLVTGLLLVPFDFAIRVRLQEAWAGPQLWVRLLGLMLAGGVLTILALPDAGQVALASVSAFAGGSIMGALAYTGMSRWWRALARPCALGVMSAVDSMIFPMIAFEQVSVGLMVGQFFMKWLVSMGFLRSLQMLNMGGRP